MLEIAQNSQLETPRSEGALHSCPAKQSWDPWALDVVGLEICDAETATKL